MAIKCSAETTVTNQIDATDLIMWYYATTLTTKPLSPSTTSASVTPTGWSLIEPTIASASDLSKYIYECLQIVWGDGTCSWGDVQLSASFEAAKQAYNLAHSTASIFTTFEQTHNKTLVDTVNESSSAITTLTESHQYGGINLLSNTKSIDSSSAPYTNSNISLYSNQAPIDGESFYYCSGPKYFQIDFPTLINNQKYTLSFDISRSSDSRPVFVKINETETNIGTAAATTWTRLFHTFTASASTTNAQIRVAFDSTSSTATYIAAIRHIKLEQGSLATPWEYSSNDISTLSNTVNTVSQTADSNSSTISNLTQTLGTNANGTTKTDDIVHQVSDISQDLNGITTRVGKTEIALKGNYAISSTAKGTANKQATISPALANYELVQGAAITVKFTTENTAANPTLNINSTGAKPIKTYSGAALSESEYKWDAGSTMTFVYDGTNWCIQDSTELTRIKSNETLINQTANNVLIKATESDTTAAQGGQHLIQSLINVAPSGIKISADKVDIEGAAIFSENGYLSQDNINAINNESQTIYIQAVSGTSSVSGTTTWVTNTGESVTQDAANLTPVWTIKRPIYRTNYPVLFVATQYKTIDGTVTCTTPLKDDTITVIDAGHITTGTIDASNITVTNLNADNITTGTINGQRIGAGSLSLDKLAEDVYTETEVNNIVDNLQTQIDGAIETWTGTNIPTLNNTPASAWTTNSIKDTHVGDVYFVVNDQSQQNGYNYRFTKTTSNGTSTYSWQLIKDNDVTNALQRLTTAEGKIGNIETFDSTVSSYMTNTDNEITSIKSAATTLSGRVDTAEGTLATKVDTSTFNTLSQTVNSNVSSIQQLTTETTTLTEKVTLGAPYTQVEWVESDGHQFVQLDWVPNKNGEYGFEIDFENYNTRNTTNPDWTNTAEVNRTKAGFILGARDSSNASSGNQFVFGCYTPGYFYVGTSVNYDPHMYYDGRRQQCSYRNGIYTAPNGNTYEIPCGSVHPRWGMVIFALSNNATKSSYYLPSSTKLYSCKFYEGDKLAVDLVGAIRNSDGMTGLYDKVENRFWACSGLGTGEVVGDLGTPRSLIEQTYSFNPTVMDTKDVASRLWSGDAPMLNKIEDGQQITYRIRQGTASSAESDELYGFSDSGSSYNVYLRLKLANGEYTNWVPCYYIGATRLTTHYGGGNDIHFTYHENQVIGNAAYPNGWWADANYDSNTNDNARYVQWYNNVLAKAAIRNASIICGDDSGYQEIGNNVTFDLSYPLLWRTAALAINKTDYQYSYTLTYDRTLATCYPDISGVKNQILYLVGEPSGGEFTIKTPVLTFDIPTEEDDLYYIPIGKLGNQSTGQNYLIFSTAPNPTMFAFIGDAFQQVQGLVVRTANSLNETIDTVSEHTRKIGTLETTVETKADSSTVTTVSNRLNTVSDTVDGHTQSITSLNTTVATKADSSTVSTLQTQTNIISNTVDGHTQSIGNINSTLATKADGSTVTTLSNQVNNISDTVDGHTSSISSLNTTVATKADSSTVTTLSNDYATFKQQVTGFESTVGETYATKTEVSDLSDELDSRTSTLGYSVIVSSDVTDLTVANPSATLTAKVYKDGEELTSADIALIGSVKWYKGSTLVGTGLTLSANQKARYIARLEATINE